MFNGERYIEEALLSILNQDYKPLEIIVVDDDSPDGTADLVRRKAQSEQRIKLVRRVGRSGLASAIKEGLAERSDNKTAQAEGADVKAEA